MKILIVAPYFFEPHRWMISAYKAALELSRDHEVVVLTTGKPRFEQRSSTLRIYRLFDLFLPDPVNYSVVPNLAFRLWQIARREKPDVVIVNKFMFFTSFAIPLFRLMGQKVITVTDTFPGYNWLPRSRFVALVMRAYFYLIGLPLLWMSSVVVLLHEGLVPAAKALRLRYRVIHNGVQESIYDAARPSTTIPHDTDRVNIAYVGRLESIKGYDYFLRTAQTITKQNSRVHVYLVGNAKDKQDVVQRYEGPQIHFLGHRTDLPSLYPRFDIFVLPSFSEGLPNALMEAMYCGVACVASDVGGAKVLLGKSGAGLLFPPGDNEALSRQLHTLIEDPALRRRLGEQAHAFIAADFTWSAIRQQYQQLFEELTQR